MSKRATRSARSAHVAPPADAKNGILTRAKAPIGRVGESFRTRNPNDPDDYWTYELEMVRCGRPRCRSCPHGPYWYRYMHVNGRMRKEYVGKRAPWERTEEDDDH